MYVLCIPLRNISSYAYKSSRYIYVNTSNKFLAIICQSVYLGDLFSYAYKLSKNEQQTPYSSLTIYVLEKSL